MNVQIIRSISVLLIGLLFILLGDSALSMLVLAVGVLLMIPGLYALVSYVRHIERHPMFPLAALGSSLLGLWMVVSPVFFVGFFMYVTQRVKPYTSCVMAALPNACACFADGLLRVI